MGVWKSLTVVEKGVGGSVQFDVKKFFFNESTQTLQNGSENIK